MRIFYTDHFVLPLPQGHRFPMRKYALLRQRVAESGIVAPEQLLIPHAATNAELLRAHDAEYLQRSQAGALTSQEIRRIGFPWSPEMVERSRRSSGATIEACRAALEDGVSANLAGGTHHAYADHGEGYCVFNDSAVAARAMQAEGRASRIVIIDCDVHQGNGTAAILAGYGLMRRMLPASVAALAALLWAADPFVIAYSRVLHVDGLAGTFITLSLLAACVYWFHDRRSRFLILSAISAGLAILSKSPALVLLPLVGLIALVGQEPRTENREPPN